ncbi:MAG TPA: hypothetical protein VLD62_06550 [Acidimicrobiia bacterium]|nr:hypothetical protein [Acidimicrobiia bacterium]
MYNAPQLMEMADVMKAERLRSDLHAPTRAAPRRIRTALGHAIVVAGERMAHGQRRPAIGDPCA